MPLQIRRGTEVERENMAQPLAQGELLYTTDNRILYVGDGTTLGGVQITGYRDEDAQDAAAAMITSGIHSGINFVYNDLSNRIDATVDLSNYTGTLKADSFKGSVVGDDSTILVDALSGTFNGDLNGDILTAAQPNITSVGTLTSLAVTGAVTSSSFTGNIFTNSVDSADSSSINVIPNVVFNSDITVENELNVSKIVIDSVTHTSIGRELYPTPQAGEVLTHYLTFVDGITGPATVKTDGDLRYTPSTEELSVGKLIVSTSTNCPSILTTNVLTANVQSDGALLLYSNLTTTASARLVTVGSTAVDGRFQVATSTYTAINLVNINQNHDTADAVNFQFNRARGSLNSPTVVQSGDDIIDLAFAGFDGTSLLVRAAISATVNGAVSTGVVPMKVAISTSTNGSGNPVEAVVVNDQQQTTFNGAIKLAVYADDTARNLAIPTPTAGMMIFNTTGTKFQGYTGAAWVDLN
jgi:hypothetical protein